MNSHRFKDYHLGGKLCRTFFLMSVCTCFVIEQHAFALSYWWDTSATTGIQTGSGTWDVATTASWNTSPNGIGTFTTWANGNDAYFRNGVNNPVTISGAIQVGNLASETSAANTTISGGSLQIGSATVANTGIMVNNGSLTIDSTVAVTLNGNQGSSHRTIFNNFVATGTLVVNGNIGQTAAATPATLRISGAYPITLGGVNNFTGGIQIRQSAGAQTLTLTQGGAAGSGGILFGQSGDTTVTTTLNCNFAVDGTVSPNLIMAGGGANQAIINSSGAGAANFTGSMLYNVQLGSSGLYGAVGPLAFKLGGASTGNNTFGGNIINSGSGASITSLTKQDAGKWILAGANTFTGNTTVSGGTLLVNGSLAAGSAVAVSSGATLGGEGTIGGAVTVNSGGTLSPGTALMGTLTINNTLALSGNGNFRINKTGSTLTSDQVAGATSISATGTLSVTATGDALDGGDTFTLFNVQPTGSFASVNLPALGSGLNWWTENNYRTITVNRAPAASNLTLGAAQGESATMTIIGGKHAPTDDDDDTMNITVQNPSDQGAAVSTDGISLTVDYSGVSGYSGSDSFTYTVSDGRGGSVTRSVTVTVSAASAGPNIVSLTGTPPTITVNALGIPGALYQLQYTDGLSPVNWQDVGGTVTATATGSLTFTDPTAPMSGRYYRTRYVSGL